jgi:polysaccharide biosynthesis/export protein
MRTAILAMLATGLMVSANFSGNQSAPPQEKKDETKEPKSQGTPDLAQTPAKDPTYKIGPQDILRIDVWREDQLTRTVPVRPDGKITLPLLNDVQAAGLTPIELAGVIRDELKKFITNPQVTVSVTEINSLRIYVTGEVTKAGAYQLLPHMTVLQALSGSGGFTAFAKVKNIYVLRTENGKPIKIPFNYKEAINGKNSEQNIELQAGDVVVVP